jgi:hypothetical protein
MKGPVASHVLVSAVVAVSLVTLSMVALGAHDRKNAGALTVVLGWGTEPAFSGSLNAVVVSLADRTGPLAKAEGELSVEVTFGTERVTLALEPVFNRPHEFHAPLVPTRAGTYTFHVTGRINKQPIDITSTCADSTFHCVTDASAIQFPVKDPSVGQLAERIDRSLPRADDATAAARSARLLAIAALGISIAGVAAALTIGLRSSRNRA